MLVYGHGVTGFRWCSPPPPPHVRPVGLCLPPSHRTRPIRSRPRMPASGTPPGRRPTATASRSTGTPRRSARFRATRSTSTSAPGRRRCTASRSTGSAGRGRRRAAPHLYPRRLRILAGRQAAADRDTGGGRDGRGGLAGHRRAHCAARLDERLSDGPLPDESGQSWTTFVILREPPAHRSAILVQVPVNTWQAYNGWGGMSLYEFDYAHGERANHVSFDRPYAWKLQGGAEPAGLGAPDSAFPRAQRVRRLVPDGCRHRSRPELTPAPSAGCSSTATTSTGRSGSSTPSTSLGTREPTSRSWVPMPPTGRSGIEDAERTIVSYKSFSDPIADPSLKTVRFRELIRLATSAR